MHDNINQQFDTVTLSDLSRLSNVISLEGMSAAQFMVDSKARISLFFNKTETFFKQLHFQAVNGHPVSGLDLTAAVNKVGFVSATQKEVIVPPGFIGLWLPYCKALEEGLNKASRLPAMLEQYNIMLGKMISDPELLKAISGIPYTGDYDTGVADHVEQFSKQFFEPNNETYIRELGAVTERVADITATYASLNAALKVDRLNPAANVTKAVTRSMGLSKTLLPQLDEDGRISKVVREQLIKLTYSLAREVEAYSVLLYRLKQFEVAMQDTSKHLKK